MIPEGNPIIYDCPALWFPFGVPLVCQWSEGLDVPPCWSYLQILFRNSAHGKISVRSHFVSKLPMRCKKLLSRRYSWLSSHASHSDFWSSPLLAGSSFACSVSSLGQCLDVYPPGRRHLRDSAPADCRLGEGKSSTWSACAHQFNHHGSKLSMPSNQTVANIFASCDCWSRVVGALVWLVLPLCAGVAGAWFPFDFRLIYFWCVSWFPFDFLVFSSWFPFDFLMIFLWFSFVSSWFPFGFLMISSWFPQASLWMCFSWFPHDFLVISSWFPYDFLMFSFDFLMISTWFANALFMVSSWFLHGFRMLSSWFLRFPNDCLLISLWFPCAFLTISSWFPHDSLMIL